MLQRFPFFGRTADTADPPSVAGGPVRGDEPGITQPAIALALGGGAARGFAHIGVLRVLEKHGIRPTIVAGTSIGAVVGGMWAAGKLDEFEAWALALTKRGILRYIDPAFAAAGLIHGKRLSDRLALELAGMEVETLPVTFGTIATELGTGHEIWLTRGSLADAIQASYSLPGVFTPHRVGNRWLMDGALVNPLPVSMARAMGGRLVIAVNLNSEVFGRGTVIQDHGGPLLDPQETVTKPRPGFTDLFRPDRLWRGAAQSAEPGAPRAISGVMIDAFNVMQDRITRARLAGDPPDVMIAPKLGKIGLFDFHRAREAVEAGKEAAERMIEDITTTLAALR